MRPVLLVDFGSTYTKLTAVDLDHQRVLAHAQTRPPADSDMSLGLDAFGAEEKTGPQTLRRGWPAPPPSGGVNMVISARRPGLTAKAA